MTHPLLSPFSLPRAATAPLKLLRHGHCCLHDKQPELFITAPCSPGLPSAERPCHTPGCWDQRVISLPSVGNSYLHFHWSPAGSALLSVTSGFYHCHCLLTSLLPLAANQSVLPRAARRASQIKCTSRACSTSARALPSNRSLLWPASYEALCEMPSSFCDLITCAFPHSVLSSQWHLADPSTQNLFLSVPCALPPACGIRPLIFLSPARSWFRSHLCREALPGLSSMHALSRSVVSDSVTPWTRLAPLSMGSSPGKNTAVGCHSLLQGSSQTRDGTRVSCTAGRLLPV